MFQVLLNVYSDTGEPVFDNEQEKT